MVHLQGILTRYSYIHMSATQLSSMTVHIICISLPGEIQQVSEQTQFQILERNQKSSEKQKNSKNETKQKSAKY